MHLEEKVVAKSADRIHSDEGEAAVGHGALVEDLAAELSRGGDCAANEWPAPDQRHVTAPTGVGAPDDQPTQNVEITRTYSSQEVLRQKDFSEFTGREMAEARSMMAQLTWDLGQRRTRRMITGSGDNLDLRRTMRRSLRLAVSS